MVVVTEHGTVNDLSQISQEIKDVGVALFVIGVGNGPTGQFEDVSSDPDDQFLFVSFLYERKKA